MPLERVAAIHDFGQTKILEFESNELARAVATEILYGGSYGCRFVAMSPVGLPKEDLHAKASEVKLNPRVISKCPDCGQDLELMRRDLVVCNPCMDARKAST